MGYVFQTGMQSKDPHHPMIKLVNRSCLHEPSSRSDDSRHHLLSETRNWGSEYSAGHWMGFSPYVSVASIMGDD
jgi:hypothetical protein